MAHGGADDVTNRHLKYWQRDGDVVFLSPVNDPVGVSDGIQWCVGVAGHAIEDANGRVLAAINGFLKSGYDRLAFYEYDSFSLRPIPWHLFPEALCCPAFSDTRAERGFVGTRFTHPPLFMSRRIASHLAFAMQELGTNCENFFWDRYVGLATERHQIPVFNLLDNGMAYARNPIEGEHIAAAAKCIEDGGFCVHGIKTEAALKALPKRFP
jgi:hypothetical protein